MTGGVFEVYRPNPIKGSDNEPRIVSLGISTQMEDEIFVLHSAGPQNEDPVTAEKKAKCPFLVCPT